MSASQRTRDQVATRRIRALQLRTAGATLQQIADELGYRTPAAVSQDIARALKARAADVQAMASLHVALELERFDALERQVQATVRRASQSGDHLGVMRGVDRLLRISDRRTRLLMSSSRLPALPSDDTPPDSLDRAREERRKRRAKFRAAG